MTESIIVAVLSLVGTLAGAYAANRKSATLIAYRLEELEKKVSKHNTLVERMYNLETKADVFEEKLKVANHRIDDLEKSAS
jgi:type VI protein secretion system component VasK